MKQPAWFSQEEREEYEQALGALWRLVTLHREGPLAKAVLEYVEPVLLMVMLEVLGFRDRQDVFWDDAMKVRVALSSLAADSNTPFQYLGLRDIVRGCEELMRGQTTIAQKWAREAEEQIAYSAMTIDERREKYGSRYC